MNSWVLLGGSLSLLALVALYAIWARLRSPTRVWPWLVGYFERTPETRDQEPPPNWLLVLFGSALGVIALLIWLGAPPKVSLTCEARTTSPAGAAAPTIYRAEDDEVCPGRLTGGRDVRELTIRSILKRDDARPDAFAIALMGFGLTLAVAGLFFHRIESLGFGSASVSVARSAVPSEVASQAAQQGIPTDAVPWIVTLATESLPVVKRQSATDDYQELAREAATEGVSEAKRLIKELERQGAGLTRDELSEARSNALEELVRLRIRHGSQAREDLIEQAAAAAIQRITQRKADPGAP